MRYIEIVIINYSVFQVEDETIVLGSNGRQNAQIIVDFLHIHPTRLIREFYRQYEERYPFASLYATGDDIPVFEVIALYDHRPPYGNWFPTRNSDEYIGVRL